MVALVLVQEVKRNHEEASMLLEALTLNLQSVMMTLNEKLHCSPAPLAAADARPPPAAKSSSSSPDLPLGAYPSPTPPLRKASMLSSVLSPASKRRADTPQKALPVAPTSSRGTTPTPAASAASTAAPPVVAPLPPYQPSPSPSTRTATPGGTRKPLPRTPTQPPAAMPAPTPATDTIAIPPKHDGHLAASPTSVSLMSAAAKLGSLRSAASSDVADADAAATDADRSSSSSSSSSSLSRDVSPSPDAASPERSASHSRNATPSFVQRPLVQASPSLRRAKATASEPTSLSRPYDAGSAPSTPTRRKAPIDPSLAAAQRVVRVGDGTSPEHHDAPTHHDDEEHAADGASTPSSSSSRSRNATVLVHDREALMIEKPVISETEVMILPPTPEQLEAQEEMLRKWERMQKKIETAEQFGLEMPEIEVEKPEQPQSGLSKVTNTIVEALVGSEQHRNTRIRDEADDEKRFAAAIRIPLSLHLNRRRCRLSLSLSLSLSR